MNFKLYYNLFKINFSISAFTFGGGYVVIPMMKKYFVDGLDLISHEELLEISAIAQSTPGAIAVNNAVLVGYRIKGLKGALICALATILPPLIILSVISFFYDEFRSNKIISSLLKGMEAGVAATIVDLLIDMTYTVTKDENLLFTLLVPVVFIANFFFNVNVLILLLLTVTLCIGQVFIKERRYNV